MSISECVIFDALARRAEIRPLELSTNTALNIFFYKRLNHFATLDNNAVYIAYCRKGVMSRL